MLFVWLGPATCPATCCYPVSLCITQLLEEVSEATTQGLRVQLWQRHGGVPLLRRERSQTQGIVRGTAPEICHKQEKDSSLLDGYSMCVNGCVFSMTNISHCALLYPPHLWEVSMSSAWVRGYGDGPCCWETASYLPDSYPCHHLCCPCHQPLCPACGSTPTAGCPA